MASVATTTLYDKIGGATAVEAGVKEFYDRVLADSDLKGFFAKTDIDRQTQAQIAFITMALGGPNRYNGKPMIETHTGLGITELHFDQVANHLVQAFRRAGVDREDVNDIIDAIAPLKTQIVDA